MEVEIQTMASYDTKEKLKKAIQIYTKDLNKKKLEMRQLDEDESRYQLVSDMEYNSKEKSQERETKGLKIPAFFSFLSKEQIYQNAF